MEELSSSQYKGNLFKHLTSIRIRSTLAQMIPCHHKQEAELEDNCHLRIGDVLRLQDERDADDDFIAGNSIQYKKTLSPR